MAPEFGKVSGFQWDAGNATKSISKHGVTTQEAEEVFADPGLLILDDPDHSTVEERWKVFGMTSALRFLTVSFTIRGDLLRVISARPMNRKERKSYEEKNLKP